MVKNLNSDDATDISAAFARLSTSNQTGHVLLRGRIESLQRARKYQTRAVRSHQSCDETLPSERLTNVIILIGYTNLRSEPLRGLLQEFESLIRETQLILQRARQTSLCKPGNVSLDWSCATSETYAWGRRFQLYIWEGLRAFREQRMHWAGICWRYALMQLERLSWLPDLDTWTIFIRSCVRLARFGAKEVGQTLLQKLSWLYDKLPATAPHRAFLRALIDVPYTDLVSGSPLLLEAKLRIVETLWSSTPVTCINYQAELAEECFPVNSDTCGILTSEMDSPEASSMLQIWREVEKDESRVTKMLLNADLSGAQSLIQKSINRLESMGNDYGGDVLFQTLLSRLLAMLGHFQFFQNDQTLDAQASYMKALSLNDRCVLEHSISGLEMPHVHRTWFILKWMAKNAPEDAMYSETTCDAKMLEIELEIESTVDIWSNTRLGAQDGQQLLDRLLDQSPWNQRSTVSDTIGNPPNLDETVDDYKAGQIDVRAEHISKQSSIIANPRQGRTSTKQRSGDETASQTALDLPQAQPGRSHANAKPVAPWN